MIKILLLLSIVFSALLSFLHIKNKKNKRLRHEYLISQMPNEIKHSHFVDKELILFARFLKEYQIFNHYFKVIDFSENPYLKTIKNKYIVIRLIAEKKPETLVNVNQNFDLFLHHNLKYDSKVIINFIWNDLWLNYYKSKTINKERLKDFLNKRELNWNINLCKKCVDELKMREL